MASALDSTFLSSVIWAIIAWAIAWVVAWAIYWRRRALRWPLAIGLVPLLLLVCALVLAGVPLLLGGVVFSVVLTIGAGKCIVWVVGHRGILACSKLKEEKASVRPEGLVR